MSTPPAGIEGQCGNCNGNAADDAAFWAGYDWRNYWSSRQIIPNLPYLISNASENIFLSNYKGDARMKPLAAPNVQLKAVVDGTLFVSWTIPEVNPTVQDIFVALWVDNNAQYCDLIGGKYTVVER